MKRLIILVLAVLVTASDLRLGDRIVSTEKECQRIYDLNKNWSVNYYNEQAAQYIDLYFICIDSLNEDKYKYIDEDKVDMTWYPGDEDKLPVKTREGVQFVSKPPPRKPEEAESMKKKIADYLKKTGGTINPIYKLMNLQSGKGQDIVDKQVECETLALNFLKNKDDKDGEILHKECINQLYCLKERFMNENMYTREHYPDFFPILYKNRGTMIKSPPKMDQSPCETSVPQEESEGELEKWMRGVEYLGQKLTDAGQAGSDFIQHLIHKGTTAGDKILSKNELDDLMTDVQSVEVVDDDKEKDNDNEKLYKVYGNMMMDKLADLESKGINVAYTQLDKAKPVIDKVQKTASITAGKLKQLEQSTIKPTVEKTAQVLNDVKDGITVAGVAAKTASTKVINGGSDLIRKLTSQNLDDRAGESELHEEVPSGDSSLIDDMIQPEYLPKDYNESQGPTLLQMVKDMGKGGGITDKMSEQEMESKIKALKASAKNKIANLKLTKEEIIKSATVVKGVINVLLTAAGKGDHADMKPNEVEKAKSLVDELVSYATAELINKSDKIGQGEEEEDEDDEADKKEKNLFVSTEPLTDSNPTKNEPVKVPTDASKSVAENLTAIQPIDGSVGKVVGGNLDESHAEVQKSRSDEVGTGNLNQATDQTVKNVGQELEDNNENLENVNPEVKKDKLENVNLKTQDQTEKANSEQDEVERSQEYTAITIPEPE
uniref:NcSP75 protein n=1 Tax=Nephotettix cincticeps TaxID=94400 RepID=A0A0E4AWH1_NEPCI|nr:NcSP75 [Nephotettix cincticeps]